jgi:CHAT domain-containing protein
VSGEKTRDLMILFYRNLFERKLTKSEALRQAQITMADEGAGDPGPLR